MIGVRNGTLRDEETSEIFQKFILNKEVFWFPWITEGVNGVLDTEIPPLVELIKGFFGKGATIRTKLRVDGASQKLMEQFMFLIQETKREEKRQMDAVKVRK